MTIKQTSYNTINPIDYYHYILLHWFRILRKCRRQYKLSVNALMVLNACYMYCKYERDSFSPYAMVNYYTYYDVRVLNKYLKVLLCNGYLALSYQSAKFKRYKLTSLGVQCIDLLRESYESYSLKRE